jgi:Peptidase family M23
MNTLLNLLVRKLVKWLLPVPFLEDALADFLCRYKLQVVSIIALLISLPFILVATVFASPITPGQPATQEIMSRQYFDRKYDVQCRDKIVVCEVKPEFRVGGSVDCTITPDKCRVVRKVGDCGATGDAANTTFKDKYCEVVDGVYVKKSGADELYYQDQQKAEESSFNVFNWIACLFGGCSGNNSNGTGTSGSSVNWNDPANPPSIGSIPNSIKDYLEPGFVDSGSIQGNPFGEFGYSPSCGYLCYSDSVFGTHYGFDMTPSLGYYNTNNASSKLGGKPVFFATCSGVAKTRYSNESGNMIEVKCSGSNGSSPTTYTSFYHVREYYVPMGEYVSVKAGQPIGVMGGEAGAYWSGGYTTGPHLHYQINVDCLGYSSSCTRNPVGYLGG